ncbi:MAG: SDR family NAD(P)-dependent oxidoreductase [Ilumatobacteraceae bacterium]
MDGASLVDAALELPVFTSFTRLGYDARSRVDHWTPLDRYDLTGRVVVVTGATSGLGRVGAEQMARCGATVVLWGRDRDKTERVRDEIAAATGNTTLEVALADTGDLDAVRAAAAGIAAAHERVDALVHNAGALTADRRTVPGGLEATIASQVVGPFLLTSLLLDRLRGTAPGRVVTMSSGGMYASPLRVTDLQMGDDYNGTEQYARAKRAQVTLNEMWAQRVPKDEVVFHAMHPGWADTPGVEASLPTFRKVVGRLLRTPEQGADTMVWLVADDGAPKATTGEFWLDRRPRSIHKLPKTKRSDTAERRQRLWDWVADAAGVDPVG